MSLKKLLGVNFPYGTTEHAPSFGMETFGIIPSYVGELTVSQEFIGKIVKKYRRFRVGTIDAGNFDNVIKSIDALRNSANKAFKTTSGKNSDSVILPVEVKKKFLVNGQYPKDIVKAVSKDVDTVGFIMRTYSAMVINYGAAIYSQIQSVQKGRKHEYSAFNEIDRIPPPGMRVSDTLFKPDLLILDQRIPTFKEYLDKNFNNIGETPEERHYDMLFYQPPITFVGHKTDNKMGGVEFSVTIDQAKKLSDLLDKLIVHLKSSKELHRRMVDMSLLFGALRGVEDDYDREFGYMVTMFTSVIINLEKTQTETLRHATAVVKAITALLEYIAKTK